MKIEKINEDKLKIILSLQELSEKNITLADIEKNSLKTKKFFLKLIEEIDLDNSFLKNNPQIFIEAKTDSKNSFIITITRINYLPDISEYNLLKNNNKLNLSNYKAKNNILIFSSLNEIIFLSNMLKVNFYLGKNSLYLYNNKYYLIFSKYTIKNYKFQKTYNFLIEYALKTKESEIFLTILEEKGKLIIKDKALQNLYKI